jgi:hypothetical protein
MQGTPSSSRPAFRLSAEREHFWHRSAGFHDRAISHCTGCALTQRTIAGMWIGIGAARLEAEAALQEPDNVRRRISGFREAGPNFPWSMLDSPPAEGSWTLATIKKAIRHLMQSAYPHLFADPW